MPANVTAADRLASELHTAAGRLGDLSAPLDQAGTELAAAAGTRTPRRTGNLASRNRATAATQTTVTVTNDAPYAIPRHQGTPHMPGVPWLADTLATETTTVTDAVADHIAHVLNTL